MKVNKKVIFTNINSQVMNTSVIPFLKSVDFKKENNCEQCNIFCGTSIDCYSCLLANAKSRNEIDTIISHNKTSDIYEYLDLLQKQALKHNDILSKRLSDIIESAMYLKLL